MRRLTLLASVVVMVASGCVSSYQTARIVDPGKTRVSTAASHVQIDEGSDDSDGLEAVDLLVDHGIGRQVEVGLRYTNYAAGSGGANVLTIGPKFALVKDRIAFTIPVGVVWTNDDGDGGADIGVYVLHPSVIGSAPISPNSELSGSLGFLVVVPDEGDSDSETYFGGSVGIRMSTDLDAWAFHPEIGFMQIEEVEAFSFGAAISFVL